MSSEEQQLSQLLDRPLSPPAKAVLEAIERGPIDQTDALRREQIDRLLDPRPLTAETGWCWLDDGVGYVAVRTEMPTVSGAMVDWWFDWHPRQALRYRIWHPAAHLDNRLQEPDTRGAKAHWGAVHHPVEDVGTGVVRARIAFCPPHELGFSDDATGDPRVATIVCGWAGDDTRRVRHTPMAHVFLRDPRGEGVILRSRFWLGAAVRPYAPATIATPVARLLNTRVSRRLTLPRNLPRALATHCAEEYANLAELLGELYAEYGPADG